MFVTQQVGTVTLTEPLDCRIQYETAAWFAVTRVPPGTYAVTGAFSNAQCRTPFALSLEAEGVCIEHHCPTLWGGVRIGRDETPSREIGRPMKAGSLPGQIDRASIDLLPGFRLDDEICPMIVRDRAA